MFEGLLLEVMCKEELKRTITHDFMYISVVLGFFWPTLYYVQKACIEKQRVRTKREKVGGCLQILR